MKYMRFGAMMLTLTFMMTFVLTCGIFSARAAGNDVIKTVEASDYNTSFSVLAPYEERTNTGLLSLFSKRNLEVGVSVSEINEDITITVDSSDKGKESVIVLPVLFKGNETLKLIEDSNGNTNGSCLVLDDEQNTIGYILIKNDNVSGSITGAGIRLTTLEPEIAVTATSDTFSTYFSKYSWGTTGDGYTKLSLYHKTYLTSVTPGDPTQWQEQEREAKRSSSWSLIYSKFRNNTNFAKNVSGMKNQYLCHFNTIGSLKNPWNLEVERPDPGYAATVLAACNPK